MSVDEIIKEGGLGFKSRAEVIKETLRTYYLRYVELLRDKPASE